ncbi:3-mercaptopropionate dioxygenase [Asticcacaulis endophyticus]|uniref:3-mercaptopropionate dioxygenase n=1 Tax=Asticcacaulis endophyticus TaxID=1395890 RepID=A0A918USG5_9CAUL|nr:3-mercaptopropionate dioxygenase [Asticcacaulis endophyticus]
MADMSDVVDQGDDEAAILAAGKVLLERLIAVDDWLPNEYARPHPERYQQYLLHCDSRERFSVVSFVWGAGQATPIHDHTVWGLVGVLRGAEYVESYRRAPSGFEYSAPPAVLQRGEVDAVSPRIGDVHRVSNGVEGGVSVSIHVYGANIGAVRRATYVPDGTPKPFISGYANTHLPNLWDRSK